LEKNLGERLRRLWQDRYCGDSAAKLVAEQIGGIILVIGTPPEELLGG